MTPLKQIQLEIRDNIAFITLNRPEALNALNRETMEDLAAIFNEEFFDEHDYLVGFIITGSGPKAFAAGADIKEFIGLSAEEGADLSKFGQDVFFNLERSPLPVIAAINGFALGGGCELAMACHIRIAAENAKFGQPEVNLGLIPGYGGTQRLPQLIGRGRAIELMITADIISAQEAYRIGLVNHIVPEGQALQKAEEMLRKIAQKAPIAVSNVIFCVNAIEDSEDGYNDEVEAFGDCCDTEDFAEGAAAFIEKRPADFKGI
jgi:enoyl-CoA hydratase